MTKVNPFPIQVLPQQIASPRLDSDIVASHDNEGLRRIGDPFAKVAFRGGSVTSMDKALLQFGTYSRVQNLRGTRPGFEKRKGQRVLHTVADSSNKVMTLYQFRKDRVTESHFYAQMSDGDVLEATAAPPGVTTGAFGSEVFSGASAGVPASWGNIKDKMIFSNGVDQHQIYGGTSSYVEKLIVYRGSSTIPKLPQIGTDYSVEATDMETTTVVPLDSLGNIDMFDCVYIKTPVPVDTLTFTVSAANGSAATLGVKYWNGSSWVALSISDGTAVTGATLGQTGAVTWTAPTAIKPVYLFGQNGFWYQVYITATVNEGTSTNDADIVNEACAALGSWVDSDAGTGASTQATFDSKSTFKFDSGGTAGAGNYALRTQDFGSFTDAVLYIDFSLYFDNIGTYANGDYFQISIQQNDGILALRFASDGIYIRDASDYQLLASSSTYTTEDTWHNFRIVQSSCDNMADSTLNIYHNGSIIGTAVNCDYVSTTATDGLVSFRQYGNTTVSQITYVDYIQVGNSLTSGSALDSEVEISGVTFASDWQGIINMWNGVPTDAIEIQYYDDSDGVYYTCSGAGAEVSLTTTSDKVYFSSADNICGFYVDVGETPNINSASINHVYYWDGDGWTEVSNLYDGTSGMTKSGWVLFDCQTDVEPMQFEDISYRAYWYYFTVSATLSDDVVIGITTMPYFDITELGKGYCNCIWKDRACYTFNLYGEYIYITEEGNPLALNGSDYGILKAGDGRSNRVVGMRRFHNELMVWQEELGVEGGCVTLFEGYSPTTWGKLLLSTKVGAMNDKCIEVIDGVITSIGSDEGESEKTLAFWLSRYGVCVTDGNTVSVISGAVSNYFDPKKSECVRRGYEKEMWLKYDSTYDVLRIGLVSGSSATLPNVFLVFDLIDKCWYFDTPAQELSCMCEVQAGSGDVTIIQVGGGIDDGFVYQLNYGLNDIETAIDAYATMELGVGGEFLILREMIVRMKAQSAGTLDVNIYANDILADTEALAMTVETASQHVRRHRVPQNVIDQHVSIKFQSNGASESLTLYDLALKAYIVEER